MKGRKQGQCEEDKPLSVHVLALSQTCIMTSSSSKLQGGGGHDNLDSNERARASSDPYAGVTLGVQATLLYVITLGVTSGVTF